jgi:RNA recognition motif-containing protein
VEETKAEEPKEEAKKEEEETTTPSDETKTDETAEKTETTLADAPALSSGDKPSGDRTQMIKRALKEARQLDQESTGEGGEMEAKKLDDQENTAEEGGEETRNRRVYVGNLAWQVSWQDLKDLMKNTGHEVTRADVMIGPDGRSKGCGIVEFATAEGAQQAVLTLNDTELNGRQIFVREDREDRNNGGGGGGFSSRSSTGDSISGGGGHRFSSGEKGQGRRVYIGNLSWDVAWQDLKDHMRQAGDVVHAEVICEQNGRSKGCGIVEFATDEQAKEAISTLTDTELKGRMIFVREDRESASAGAAVGQQHGGSERSQNTSVYVWNLAYETSWQDLKDHMRKAGNVDQATILTDPDGQSIGCGVVVYQRSHEAARAIRELQGSELKGRVMNLREDRVQQSGGGGRGYGQSGGRGYGRGQHGGRGGRGRGRGRGHNGGGGGHQQRGGDTEGCQLFVGNLSFDITWMELKDHFRQCGDVDRADVKFSGGKSRGFGTIRFCKAEDAEAAISRLNGVELQGRALEVRLDQKA